MDLSQNLFTEQWSTTHRNIFIHNYYSSCNVFPVRVGFVLRSSRFSETMFSSGLPTGCVRLFVFSCSFQLMSVCWYFSVYCSSPENYCIVCVMCNCELHLPIIYYVFIIDDNASNEDLLINCLAAFQPRLFRSKTLAMYVASHSSFEACCFFFFAKFMLSVLWLRSRDHSQWVWFPARMRSWILCDAVIHNELFLFFEFDFSSMDANACGYFPSYFDAHMYRF